MAELVAILVLLWLLGIIQIPWLVMPQLTIFSLLGFQVTLQKLVMVLLIVWLAMTMASPLRQILWAFFVLWLLVSLGVIAVGSTLMLIVLAVVVGLILAAAQRK